MMDYWSGERNPRQDYATALFRRHIVHRQRGWLVGEIVRQTCQFHPDVIGEFHHVDYARPFLGAWLCHSCHRKADHDSLPPEELILWDYSSIVRLIPSRASKEFRQAQAVVPF